MDILIKNMELPKEGSLVLYVQQDGTVTIPYDYTLHFETPVPQTEAIELPPHSDLIDRDELLTDLADRICVDDMLDGIYQPAIDRINEAKAVLEANNGTDN